MVYFSETFGKYIFELRNVRKRLLLGMLVLFYWLTDDCFLLTFWSAYIFSCVMSGEYEERKHSDALNFSKAIKGYVCF